MSIPDVRKRFHRLAIAGGIDVSQLLTRGTPVENVLAMIETAHEYHPR